MTVSISQPVPLSVSDLRNGAEYDQVTAATDILDVTLRHARYGPISGAAPPGGPGDLIAAGLPAGTHFIPCLPREDATRLPGLSTTDRGGVAVVRLRGELDFLSASALQAYLSDIRRQARARCVADLTGLAFIDCTCLSVLVRHCKEIRGQGGSFALAGPQPAVLRILAVTGLLTWFEVHDTVEEAATGAGTQHSPVVPAAPVRPRVKAAIGLRSVRGGRCDNRVPPASAR
jgi:anti-sigma B factor antagonist